MSIKARFGGKRAHITLPVTRSRWPGSTSTLNGRASPLLQRTPSPLPGRFDVDEVRPSARPHRLRPYSLLVSEGRLVWRRSIKPNGLPDISWRLYLPTHSELISTPFALQTRPAGSRHFPGATRLAMNRRPGIYNPPPRFCTEILPSKCDPLGGMAGLVEALRSLET